MPARALVTHGFGFTLGTRFIPTLGLGVIPAPPVPRARGFASLSSGGAPMLFVTPRPPRVDWADLVAAATPYLGAKCKLFVNDITPSVDNVLADFTEASFTGYAEQAITWDDAYIDGGGLVTLPGDNNFFLCTAGDGELIYGYYVVGAGGEFLGAARLDDAPYGIAGPGYGISIAPAVVF